MSFFVFCSLISLALASPDLTPEVTYPNEMRRSTYDYIVVGAGSSGATVASRLSEDSSKIVLLVEAGGPPPLLADTPAFQAMAQNQGGEYDWQYYTVPQDKACQAMRNKTCYYPRGKALGGTSILNAMLYVRGNSEDYDRWVREAGATGWSGDEVQYYFLKSEDQRDPSLTFSPYHKVGGPLTVSTNSYATPLRQAYLDGGKQLGYDTVDYNGASQIGFAKSQHVVRDGHRCSTEKAFLRPAVARPNLDILTYTQATKVHFDQDKKVFALEVFRNNKTSHIKVLQEIILSAGAIGSPQLLMLSGIGPKDHLEKMKIPVIVDLPGVGSNLQDHIANGGMSYVLNDTVSIATKRDFNQDAIDALKNGTGPLSVPAGMQNTAFMNTTYQDKVANWPDMQFMLFAGYFMPKNCLSPELEKMIQDYTAEKDVTHVVPTLLHPKSTGTILLKSNNPFDHPIIDPKYFSNNDDLEALVQGSKFVVKLMKTPQLAKYAPKMFPDVIEGCENISTDSDDYLRCMCKALSYTTHHQAGTCKMGDPWNPTTVVDPTLRVKGVKGLRVADASVMPFVPSANTNAPSIMVGEKAADMILGRCYDPIRKTVQMSK